VRLTGGRRGLGDVQVWWLSGGVVRGLLGGVQSLLLLLARCRLLLGRCRRGGGVGVLRWSWAREGQKGLGQRLQKMTVAKEKERERWRRRFELHLLGTLAVTTTCR
jgi:hypothetical protein